MRVTLGTTWREYVKIHTIQKHTHIHTHAYTHTYIYIHYTHTHIQTRVNVVNKNYAYMRSKLVRSRNASHTQSKTLSGSFFWLTQIPRMSVTSKSVAAALFMIRCKQRAEEPIFSHTNSNILISIFCWSSTMEFSVLGPWSCYMWSILNSYSGWVTWVLTLALGRSSFTYTDEVSLQLSNLCEQMFAHTNYPLKCVICEQVYIRILVYIIVTASVHL